MSKLCPFCLPGQTCVICQIAASAKNVDPWPRRDPVAVADRGTSARDVAIEVLTGERRGAPRN